jgi:urea transport system substrate-binding protein
VRKAAVALPAQDSPMGKIRFAANQSLLQTAYIGQLDAKGQFKIVFQSAAEIEPDPYDPLIFPGKTCRLN